MNQLLSDHTLSIKLSLCDGWGEFSVILGSVGDGIEMEKKLNEIRGEQSSCDLVELFSNLVYVILNSDRGVFQLGLFEEYSLFIYLDQLIRFCHFAILVFFPRNWIEKSEPVQ